MFRRLQVRNYVLIDSLDIEFPEGLVIITGQTGAGKSIIIGSISLVLGARGDSSIIGGAGDNCVVEAEFDIDPENAELEAVVEGAGAEWDGGHLVLRRVVSRSGRSRAFVNDCPVSVGSLSALSSALVDIHSQHQTLLLSDKKFQLSALDYYASLTGTLREYSAAYGSMLSIRDEIDALDAQIEQLRTERDYNEARFAQLSEANLRDGELEELETEQKQLANAEEIKENLYTVEALFSSRDEAEEGMSMDEALRESGKLLSRVSQYVAEAASLGERISSVRVEIDDILSEIKKTNSRITVSTERLAEVEQRISLIYGLFRKFSCRSVSELISTMESLGKTLLDSTELEQRRQVLAASLESVTARVNDLAGMLHEGRVKAAPAFAAAIEESLHFLELGTAAFVVEVRPVALSSTGKDNVTFKFSASGRNPVDVAKCASGGEMSRIMLCLKDMLARYTKMPTMIFDEIDTGVSGSVADKMGSMICRMGSNMQVFAITHLPQVAAKGEAHYLVSKEAASDDSEAGDVTLIRKLSDEERVMEVARMLSGATITPAAIANARSLLGNS